MGKPIKQAAQNAQSSKVSYTDRETRHVAETARKQSLEISDLIDICPVCENHVKQNEMGLQCEQCKQWYHAKCDNFSEDEYTLAQSKKNLKYICPKCDVGSLMLNENADEKTLLKQMMGMILSMSERLSHLEIGMKSNICQKELDKSIEDCVEAKLKTALDDEREKENRKLNLVLVNVPEARSTVKEDQEMEDKAKIDGIMRKALPDEQVIIRNPIRLGKVNAGTRARMLRITVPDMETKKKILSNAKKVNDSYEKDPSKRIFINPDYTKREQETNRALRAELKDRLQKGERDLMIKGDKIIKRPPKDGTVPTDSVGENV